MRKGAQTSRYCVVVSDEIDSHLLNCAGKTRIDLSLEAHVERVKARGWRRRESHRIDEVRAYRHSRDVDGGDAGVAVHVSCPRNDPVCSNAEWHVERVKVCS